MGMKMAEELDRVRISAAELRAEASSFITNKDSFKDVQETSKKQRHREGKRPDLQWYQPGAGQVHRNKDSSEGEVQAVSTERRHQLGQCVTDDPKMSGSSPQSSAAKLTSKDCLYQCNSSTESGSHQSSVRNTVKDSQVLNTGTLSPKLSRKTRKPDREIYQPGGRRTQSSRHSCSKKEQEPKEEVKGQHGDCSKHKSAIVTVQSKDVYLEDVTESEEKGKGRKRKESRKKREYEKQHMNLDSFSVHNDQTTVENITGKIEKLKINRPASLELEENKEIKGDFNAKKRIKSSGEGRRNRGEGGTPGEEKKKQRSNRRSRGVRERETDQISGKREEGKGGEKSSSTRQPEKNSVQTGEGGFHWDSKGKDVNLDQNVQQQKHRARPRGGERDGEGIRASEDTSKLSTASKRYSKSDIRRPRNRTYSTSSASSNTSLDGQKDSESCRSHVGLGGREKGEGRLASKFFVKTIEDKDPRNQLRQRTLRVRDMSSTDSFDENEEWERNDPLRTRKGNARGSKVSVGSGRGGILRVSLDKKSMTASGTGEEKAKQKNQCPTGRGILVLPAHTELTVAAEPGPRLMCGMRSSMSLGRGRGGRGGSTRRLWDPNNPDKKPALSSSQQSQRSPLQTSLYPHQGGYSPLHFLDTDDETTGSPPVCQGEHLQSQAAAIAYYKFQNSDNPYCYSLPNNSPNTQPRFTFPYQFPYQIPCSNGMYPNPAMPFYGAYGQVGQSYPSASGTPITPEEAEVQTRSELGKLLRLADSQELQLSNLLSRECLSPEGLDRMSQLRAELLTLYERVILTDIEFSDSQNLDQALWKNVFYQVIERFRQHLKEQDSDTAPHFRAMLLTILEEGATFFDSLLQKLQSVYQFNLEDYMDGMAIRARPLRKMVKYALISAQRCMICQGDIARYREQASDSANYGKARSWYLKAQQIAPKNGRPYNQLALLAVYTKRKLDAVYYYMRSLAASNPILTAKESLMSLFEEAKRKAEQIERRRKQDSEGGVCGPQGRGGSRAEDVSRVEIWVRPSGQPRMASGPGGSELRKYDQDEDLSTLSASDLNKRFILSFLHTHGKLFTKVGMESFSVVASRVLQEFRALLQHSPCPLGSTRMLQIMTINMFTIHYAQTRAEGQGETRSVLEEQATSLGLAMFGLLVQRCSEILKETPAEPIPLEEFECDVEEERMVRVSSFPSDLRELVPSVKVWSDWMLGYPEQWNPPPCNIDGSPDVWLCLAEMCNILARVYHGETPLYKADGDGEGDEELQLLVLEEDRMLAGFVPLLAAPQEPCYTDFQTDIAMAADCKRVTVLKYFLEALCGQEEPLLAFKGGKYISIAAPPTLSHQEEKSQSQTHEQSQDDSVIVEESSLSASEGEMECDGSEDDIRELRARRHALAHKLAQQQKRRDKIQALLQTGVQLELEIRPFYLVPDTNCFIDHLEGLRKLLTCGSYILVVPLIVITELDGLAKGQESHNGDSAVGGGAAHAKLVQECAKTAVAFLEKGFEAREPGLRALTSRGSQLESIAFRSEDTSGQKGNNDDVILSCCLHYCQDKAKDFMPAQRDGPIRLRREVVLLTDDRNLRLKALTRNVPVRDIPAFLSWAKVG